MPIGIIFNSGAVVAAIAILQFVIFFAVVLPI